MSALQVVLVDDHPIVLAGLKTLLLAAGDMDLLGEVATGTDALLLVREQRPDLAVIDTSLPDTTGIDLAGQLVAACPSTWLLAA